VKQKIHVNGKLKEKENDNTPEKKDSFLPAGKTPADSDKLETNAKETFTMEANSFKIPGVIPGSYFCLSFKLCSIPKKPVLTRKNLLQANQRLISC
jgi:hypothetical protein